AAPPSNRPLPLFDLHTPRTATLGGSRACQPSLPPRSDRCQPNGDHTPRRATLGRKLSVPAAPPSPLPSRSAVRLAPIGAGGGAQTEIERTTPPPHLRLAVRLAVRHERRS